MVDRQAELARVRAESKEESEVAFQIVSAISDQPDIHWDRVRVLESELETFPAITGQRDQYKGRVRILESELETVQNDRFKANEQKYSCVKGREGLVQNTHYPVRATIRTMARQKMTLIENYAKELDNQFPHTL